MQLIALRRFDDAKVGQPIERADRQAQQLIRKGLAKAAPLHQHRMAPDHRNQMMPEPLGKSSAAGAEQPSSASPVAPVLPQMTASLFADGVSPAKRRRKKGDESSLSTPVTD